MSVAAADSRPPRCSRAASDPRLSATAETAIAAIPGGSRETPPMPPRGKTSRSRFGDPWRVGYLRGLELLVPEVLQLGAALGEEVEIRVDQQLLLFRREADARSHVGRDLRVADHRIVAH